MTSQGGCECLKKMGGNPSNSQNRESLSKQAPPHNFCTPAKSVPATIAYTLYCIARQYRTSLSRDKWQACRPLSHFSRGRMVLGACPSIPLQVAVTLGSSACRLACAGTIFEASYHDCICEREYHGELLPCHGHMRARRLLYACTRLHTQPSELSHALLQASLVCVRAACCAGDDTHMAFQMILRRL